MTTMYNPPHPGELLREFWLDPLGLSITALAKQILVSRKTMSEIVNGRASVTADVAVRLELALGNSAQSWLSHQAAFDLWQLQDRRATLGVKRLAQLTPA